MYLLFKSVDERRLGIIQKVGYWMEYMVGELPDTHVDIVDWRDLKAKVLDNQAVANAYMFIGHSRGYISVRPGTPQNMALRVVDSEEATGEKGQYTLTADDERNTVKLMQEIMRLKLDEVYDKRMINRKVNVSELEASSWQQQREEAADPDSPRPLLTALARARGITVDAMAQKVNDAVARHNEQIEILLEGKQAVENEIKLCTTIAECNTILHNRFEVTMPSYQAEEEGVTHSARWNV